MLRGMKAAIGALVLMGVAGAAQAANNPLIVWQGGVTITSLNNGCNVLGFVEGQLLLSVFRPRLEPDEPSSGITIFADRSTQVYFNKSTTNDQMNGSGTYAGLIVGSRVTTVPNSNASFFPGTYKFTVKPATIDATTGAITITGQLTNFFNATGCTAKFLGAFQPRGE